MRFAKWVFGLAGVLGLFIVVPLYFLEERLGRDQPPPINHPEWYYGFVAVTLAWQFMYLVIATDPARYRLPMLVAAAAKGSFVASTLILFALGRVNSSMLASVALDAIWVALFLVAYARIPRGTANRAA